MRVVLTILDAFPHRKISADLTPNLWRQIELGAWSPSGGQSLPVSVTYSNHAAFVTGVDPATTGLWGNRGWVPGVGFRATYDIGPEATTLFDRCVAADLRSVAAVGDHKLIVTMGASVADESWPPAGQLDASIPLDPYGYPRDAAVIDAAGRLDLDADFVLLHLNEPDTTMHISGPESHEAAAQYRASDAAYGQLLELLAPAWDDTVLVTISDHDQETIDQPECIDLTAWANEQGIDVSVSHEGTAAVIVGELDAGAQTALRTVAGIEGIETMLEPSPQAAGIAVTYVWAEPGWLFGRGAPKVRGNHGSPRCRTQLAVVSGGHPEVPAIASKLLATPPTTLTWAPAIADLLGV